MSAVLEAELVRLAAENERLTRRLLQQSNQIDTLNALLRRVTGTLRDVQVGAKSVAATLEELAQVVDTMPTKVINAVTGELMGETRTPYRSRK